MVFPDGQRRVTAETNSLSALCAVIF